MRHARTLIACTLPVVLTLASTLMSAHAQPLWRRAATIDARINPDGTADITETWQVRAETTAVAHTIAQQTYHQVADIEDVTLIEAATLKPHGLRIPVLPAAVRDQALATAQHAPQFSAQRARTIVFPSVAAHDTVRYALHRHGTAAVFPNRFTATFAPGSWSTLDRADITLAVPPGMTLHVEARGLDEQPPALNDDGSTIRRWTRAAAPAQSVLLDASSFADHAELGRAYADRAWPRSRPGPAIQALAERLTAGAATPRDQALRLYRHVATEIRYVALFLGDGRVVPRDAETVLAEGYGDCKDHTALLQALLAARGIDAIPALISLRNLYTLPNAAGLGALNHVITYIPSLDLYLDSTAPYAPFGLLPVTEYDKPVVLADPETARLARTPPRPSIPLDVQTTTLAAITPDDTIAGTTTTEAAGPQAIALRAMAAWIEGRGTTGAASAQLRQLGTPGTGGFTFTPPEHDTPAYQVHARFTLAEPLLDGGDAPFPLPGGLGIFERPGRLLLGTALTEDNAHVCLPGREVETLTLALPPGANLRTPPHDVALENGGARYTATYRIDDNALHVRREFTVHTDRIACSPETFAEMRPVLAAARRDQRVQVSLQRPD